MVIIEGEGKEKRNAGKRDIADTARINEGRSTKHRRVLQKKEMEGEGGGKMRRVRRCAGEVIRRETEQKSLGAQRAVTIGGTREKRTGKREKRRGWELNGAGS